MSAPARAGRLAAAAAVVVVGAGRQARAQEVGVSAVADLAPRFLAAAAGRPGPVPIDPERTPFLRARISVDVRGQTVAAAVETIARAAGIRVAYSPALLPTERRVALQATGISVAAALADVLMGTHLDVLLTRSGQAALVRRESLSIPERATVVSGRVTDSASGRPLADVQVVLEGTRLGAITSGDGQYRIAGVPAGDYSAATRRVGYARARRRVTVVDGRDAVVNAQLTASAGALAQVVVTGTVVPTERRALPNAITVITAEQLAQRNITQLTELLRGEVPGVYALNTGVAAAPGTPTWLGADVTYARGSSKIDGSPSPLKLYVDGVEQADNNYLNTLDPKMIARVEILTGPQASTIYGAQAINGVMQVFTKRGAFNSRPRVTAQLGYGVIQNRYTASLAPSHDDALQLSGGGSHISYQVGGSYTATGQWTPGDYVKAPTATGGLRYEARGAHLTVDLSARVAHRSVGVTPLNPIAGDLARTGATGYDPDNVVPYAIVVSNMQQTFGLTFRHSPARWWTQTATLGSDDLRAGFAQERPRYVTPADTLLQTADQRERKASVTYNSTFAGSLTRWLSGSLTVGGDHWHAMSSLTLATAAAVAGTGRQVSATILARAGDNNTGYFSQAQVAVADVLYLTVGSRWDQNAAYGPAYGGSWAPRYGASLVRAVAGVTGKLRASYGRSIRPPLAGQSGAVPAPATRLFPSYNAQAANAVLGPELQRGWEQGVEFEAGRHVSLSVTHYDQTVDRLIGSLIVDSVRSLQRDPTTGSYLYGFISQNTNLGAIRNRGWEATAAASWWRVTARGTWSSARSRITALNSGVRDTDLGVGDQFGNIPEHSGAVSFTYAARRTTVALTAAVTGQVRRPFFTNPLFIDVYGNRFGQVSPGAARAPGSLPPDRYLYLSRPGYSRTDLGVSQALGRELDGFVRVRNLGNRYTANDLSARYPVQGRATLVGVRRTW